jgi:hypothetical protein
VLSRRKERAELAITEQNQDDLFGVALFNDEIPDAAGRYVPWIGYPDRRDANAKRR